MAPNAYSEEKATEILRLLGEGEGLVAICRAEGMPTPGTVRGWALDDDPPGFAARYARARELQAEKWADEIIEESDAADDHETAAVAKVRIDARKWIASKLLPKRFGDKLDVTSAGERLPAPAGLDLSRLSAETLRRLADELGGEGEDDAG